MTMFKPNIQIQRMSVFSKGRSVYDETFHPGLNIIRGENSSGKSTIMDFLFYALGGDLTHWRETALRCDAVFLEAEFNGKPATLHREVNPKSGRPMRIFAGPMKEAMQSGAEGWELYPYSRGSRDSFSQVLFRFLGLPEVQYGEQQTKITMNQILRLIYADQISPVDKLFKSQRFDDAVTRQTIGDLLCGAFSARYYDARLRLLSADDDLKVVKSGITSLVRAHSDGRHPLTIEWLNAERQNLEHALDIKLGEIEKLEESIFHAQFDDRLSLNDQQETYEVLVKSQADIATLKEEIDRVELERADSLQFILSIESKLEQLRDSDAVIQEFEELHFQFCPACLAAVDQTATEGACRLCKSPFDHARIKSRSLKFINEFTRQREQSLQLQDARDSKIVELRGKIAKATELWEQASRHYQVAVKTPTTALRLKLRGLNREAGYLTRQLEDLAGKSEIISQLAGLTHQRNALQDEITSLQAVLKFEQDRNRNQISLAREKISRFVLRFLRNDLARQSSFASAETIGFEFDGDRISVDGDSFFSASSMVYLKNSFLASFMFAATSDSNFAHPRLLIMDTIEDKGMEPERSQNFQRQLRDYSDTALSSHQIIIATSMIAPELNNGHYTVGEFYTHQHRTLRLT